MTKAIIGYPRWSPEASFDSSVGAWLDDYPVANLGSLPLSQVARSVDATESSAKFALTLPGTRPISLVALVRHNLTIDAQIRVLIYQDPARATVAYDSDWFDAWPVIYAFGDLAWEDGNAWTGRYVQREIDGYNWTRPIWLGTTVFGQAVEVRIRNQGGDYFECGAVEVAIGQETEFNFQYGAEYGFRYRSDAVEAEGGAKWFERRDKPRVFRGTFLASRTRARRQFYELFRQADLDEPYLWFPEPDSPGAWMRTCFLARTTDPGLIAIAYPSHDTVPFALEEVL